MFGIDLGTTYSCISYLDEVGRPTIVPLTTEELPTLPSVVYFEAADRTVVGSAAKDMAALRPGQVVSRIKREIGREYETAEIHGQRFAPHEVSRFVLEKLAEEARIFTGGPVEDVVITVPAYFGAGERLATKRAGELAGLNVIDIVSEPVAAAIDYGVINADRDIDILVYDLGGGTFDTTVISLRDGDITVVCTDGDHSLGGIDWDQRLVEHFVEVFGRQHPDAGDPLEDPETEQSLYQLAEDVKRKLTAGSEVLKRFTHDVHRADITLTRTDFTELTADLLDRTVEIARRTLDLAKERGVGQVDEILLVGGSTKMPAVAARIQEEFGITARLHDPDLAVAKGAARYAFEETYRNALRAGDKSTAKRLALDAGLSAAQEVSIAKRSIRTVASRGFGIKVTDPSTRLSSVSHMIHSNDPLPASVTEEFGTLEDDQRGIHVVVFEQAGIRESDELENNTQIADGHIPIPAGKRAGWPIEVSFALSTSGLLEIAAIEQETGERLELSVECAWER
ncbi:Hsp70 family protein [Nocardia sp. NPDC055165]